MLIVVRHLTEITALKSNMEKSFDMKDMGEASHILRMHNQRDRSKKFLYLSQLEYIDKVLQCFNIDKGKVLSTPLLSYVKLSKQDCPVSEEDKAEMDKVPYVSAKGILMYEMIAARPNIAFQVGVVSKYMSNPDKKHWEVVKGIMGYLKATMHMCICYES